MYKNIKVEAEHNELILENTYGDKVIIPANKRNWVKQKLSEGCHGCIDSLVETLPVVNNYAQDGTVFPNEKQPIVLITPSGRKVETNTDSDFYRTHYNSKLIGKQNEDKSWNLTDEIYQGESLPEVVVTLKIQPNTFRDYKNQFNKNNPKDKFLQAKQEEHNKEFYSAPLWAQQAVGGYNDKRKQNDLNRDNEEYKKLQNDFIAEKLLKRTPSEGIDNRLKWMSKFSPKELETIKNSKYANEIEPSIWSKFEQGLLSVGNMGSPVQFKNPSLSQKEAKKEDNPLNILQPLNIPSKMVQSAYKKDYSFKDALKGKQNNASFAEDVLSDFTNLFGVGIGKNVVKGLSGLSKLSKADKVIDATKVGSKVLNKTDDVVKNLPKLEQIPLDFRIEDFLKNISSTERKNMEIVKKGNTYFKELDNPESLKRLKEFGDEYNIDLLDAYKKAEERWDYGKNIGGHSKFKVKKTEEDWYGLSTTKWDYEDELRLFDLKQKFGEDSKQVKDFYKELSQKKSINYISDAAPLERYEKTIWHELSHDINKSIIDSSPKLQEDIKNIFIEKGTADLNKVKKGREYVAKDFYTKKDEVLKDLDNPEKLQKIGEDEFDYVTRPTETWAFLSTNLRQDLKNTGVIKNYNEILTPEKLEKAIKNGNTVFSRFEPYIKDKDAFIKLFNKMTLSIAPAALYLQSQQNKSEQ